MVLSYNPYFDPQNPKFIGNEEDEKLNKTIQTPSED